MWSRVKLAVATLLYHSRLLDLLNRLINRYRVDRVRRLGPVPAIRRRRVGDVQILIYHRVGSQADGFLPPLPIETFERQMRYVAANCRVLSLDDAADAIRRRDVPPNAVVITFDDGYRDNYTTALPVLSTYSLPATIFVVTGAIGNGGVIWHDRVFRAFSTTTCRELREFGPRAECYPLRTPDQLAYAERSVLRYLKSLPPERRDREIARLIDRLDTGDVDRADGLMLGWEELREMNARGVSVGAHTVSHPILSRVSPEQARREIAESKRTIEGELGCPVRNFAYPNGARADFDDTTKTILSECGFDCALTTIFGTNDDDSTDRPDMLELKRMDLVDGRLPLFATKLNVYRW